MGCEQPPRNSLTVNDYFNRSRQWHSHFDAIALATAACWQSICPKSANGGNARWRNSGGRRH